jgi:competence protein ComEC
MTRLRTKLLRLSKTIFYLFLCLVLTLVYLYRLHKASSTLVEGARIRLTGQISEDPVVQAGRQRLVVGNVRIYTDSFPEYLYGDRIIAEGRLAKGKGGWYLEKTDRLEKVKDAENIIISIRQRVLELYKRYLPEPHAGLVSGIVLGTKSSLDSGFFEALRTTGTLHIVVASGTNISIFAGTILTVLAYFLGRRHALFPALIAVWFYVFLVGWQPPIVRAGVMGSVAFTAQALGREFDSWRALLFSAAVLLILNPLWLWDVGFQLSFAATAGILAFYHNISRILHSLPIILKESIATTLSAQIAVSPILLFSFGQISLIAPVVNALVLWIVPAVMIGGMALGVIGILSQPLGQFLAWFLWVPLEYFIQIVMLFSKVN